MDVSTHDLLSTLTDPEIDAMIEIMVLAAGADGSLDYAEIAALKRTLISIDEQWLGHVDLESRIEQAKVRIGRESRAERLAKLRTMLPWPEQRLMALKLAVRIVAADGIVAPSERELVLEAAAALGVRDDIAEVLVSKAI